jgi:uncharacterized membrane protein
VSRLKQPETIFLIVSMLFGLLICFLVPPGGGYDETQHIARAWEMSGGFYKPNQRFEQGPYLPIIFQQISYRNRYFITPLNDDFFNQYFKEKIDMGHLVDYSTKSVYFPFLYLPTSFGMWLFGRILALPILWIYFLCRILQLLTYVFITYLAIRIIPFGKWVLFLFALSPMAMLQAGTISPDAYTNAISFLFVAWIIHLSYRDLPMTWFRTSATLVLVALLLVAKVNVIFLILLFVLLPKREMNTWKYLAVITGTLLVISVAVVYWNVRAFEKFPTNAAGYGVIPQLQYILSHPLAYLQTFFKDIGVHGISYYYQWVGVYGYGYPKVPGVIYPLFSILLLVVWLFDTPDQAIRRRLRVVLSIAFIAGYVFTVTMLYLTSSATGDPLIRFVHGRYLIPVAPLLFLALLPRWKIVRFKLPVHWIAPAGSAIVLLLYSLGMIASFYMTCGTSYYTQGLCYQPVYKNWDPNAHASPILKEGISLTQSFSTVCSPMQSFRVWVENKEEGVQGSTVFILRDSSSGAEITRQVIQNVSAPTNGWLEIGFAPVDEAVGQTYEIEIASEDVGPSGSLAFGISAKQEYWDGSFRMNGEHQESDILFQYGCASR